MWTFNRKLLSCTTDPKADRTGVWHKVDLHLPEYAQEFWDANLHYFSASGLKKSFYYYGTSGNVAWIISQYFRSNRKLRTYVYQLLDAESLAEQKEIYAKIEPELWNTLSQWLMKHPVVMAMLGVPRPPDEF